MSFLRLGRTIFGLPATATPVKRPKKAWVKTYPLFFRLDFWHSAASMFLRSHRAKKGWQGLTAYFSVVENRRLPGSRTVQRTVLYLGEINDQQQAAWRKTLDVFDEDEQGLPNHEPVPG